MKDANTCVNVEPDINAQRTQYIETFILAFAGFIIPFSLGHPQNVVGVLVNALIIRAAMSLPTKTALPVLLMPGLGAISRGLLFGPFTVFLLYMTPFIWAGNAILFYAFRNWKNGATGYAGRLVAGAFAKTGLLFTAAYMLHGFSILPAVFLTTMGALQLYTALGGGMLAYAQIKTEKYLTRQ